MQKTENCDDWKQQELEDFFQAAISDPHYAFLPSDAVVFPPEPGQKPDDDD